MNAVQFAFWLQGYFEIQGGTPSLNTNQAQAVLKKAQAVRAENSEAEREAGAFVAFTEGTLSVALEARDPALLTSTTGRLATKLNDLFIHAIDPTIQGDQTHLRRTHRPGGNGGIEAMC